MKILHLLQHVKYIVPLDELCPITVKELEAVVIQYIHTVMIFIGITVKVADQLLHILEHAIIRDTDLLIATLQNKRCAELLQEHHLGPIRRQRIRNEADPLRRFLEILEVPEQSDTSVFGIVVPLRIDRHQGDLLRLLFCQPGGMLHVALERVQGRRVCVEHIIALCVDMPPLRIDYILETAEHLMRHFAHLI